MRILITMKMNRIPMAVALLVGILLLAIPTESKAAMKGGNSAISRIMKAAHEGKNSLANKAKAGKASPAQVEALAKMYRSLYNQKPPKGSSRSWKLKTVAILRASETLKRKPTDAKARAAYSKALNCTACHRAHR
ncbi:MAG: hypothetical protein ACKVHO_02090 [Verrucomicrobiia bacterium]|jgi:hypothetical protein